MTRDKPLYIPFLGERYSLGRALPPAMIADQYGQGRKDAEVFQADAETPQYLDHKTGLLGVESLRREHVAVAELPDAVADAAGEFMRARIADDAPLAGRGWAQLAARVAEDVAIHCRDASGADRLAAAHVCFPSGWSPAAKVGRSFAQIHAPVEAGDPKPRTFLRETDPDAGSTLRDYVGSMMRARESLVRFIWSLQRGAHLNANPASKSVHPATLLPAEGPDPFDTYLRVERQTITALPLDPRAGLEAAIFTIRVYLYPLSLIVANDDARAALRGAIASMPAHQIRYKGWTTGFIADVAARLAP